MPEYKEQPTEFAAPTPDEIRARSRRNIAIALALIVFMGLVAFSIVVRSPVT